MWILVQIFSWIGMLMFCLGFHCSWLAMVLDFGIGKPLSTTGLGFFLLLAAFLLSMKAAEMDEENGISCDA